MFTHCHFIVGMHLNGEVVLGIDELDEQRQFVAILTSYGTTKNLVGHLVDDIDERHARPMAVIDDGR